MTAELQAEESALESGAANAQMLLNQLREITGIHDSSFLHEALKASNGDLTQAVSLLTEEGAKEPSVETEATEPSDIEGSAVGKQAVIDLTNDKEALQAAIALSLRDSANQQADGRDPCRSNETELSESRNRSKRKRCEVWRDHPNPNEWRRVDNWPVGMKNIGNTCWFSAVIQSLFQLPEFRRLVLGYNLPQSILENCQNHNVKWVNFPGSQFWLRKGFAECSAGTGDSCTCGTVVGQRIQSICPASTRLECPCHLHSPALVLPQNSTAVKIALQGNMAHQSKPKNGEEKEKRVTTSPGKVLTNCPLSRMSFLRQLHPGDQTASNAKGMQRTHYKLLQLANSICEGTECNQRRIASSWILLTAIEGDVCARFGSSCCTAISDWTGSNGTSAAIQEIRTLQG